jgi:hypothetical protein
MSTVFQGRRLVLLSVALCCVLELLPGVPGPFTSVAGLWLLFGAPTAVWYGTAAKVVSGRDSALLLALGLAVITDMVVGLGINTLLPLFGNLHPLSRTALAGGSSLVLVALGAFLPEARRPEPLRWRGLPRGLVPVASLGALCLLLSVAGPIRLNNGLGSGVSMTALVAVAALLLLLLVRRRRYPVPVLETGLYLAAAGLLLLTSLRGWSITGHDVQTEYEYFRLTLGGGRWTVGSYPDAYNACLSITLLPVSVARLTTFPDIWIFKALLPLLFACTPVLVHRSVRNVAPQLTALLSAVFFMAFPTFFTDMVYLGRQEVAFLLLGCGSVVLTDATRPLRRRRIMFMVLVAGMVLSHYSTTYVLVATLGLTVAADLLWRLAALPGNRRGRNRVGGPGRRKEKVSAQSFVTWWMVPVAGLCAVLWAGPVTHTSGQLQSTVSSTLSGLLHGGKVQSGSSDVSYSLFGGQKVTPQQRLDEFRQDTVTQTAAKRATGDYLPLAAVDGYPTPVVTQASAPLTAVGRAVASLGIKVGAVNGLARQAAAALLQLLLLLGIPVALRSRHRSFRPTRDQVTLTLGMLGVLAVLTVLPQLSVDYSVLRAFQQGLLLFAPFLAAATLWVLRWARSRTVPIALACVTALFLDLTGFVPTLLGGYPAQLALSNSGSYYDIYYPHPEEREAAYWLSGREAAAQAAGAGTPLLQTDRYSFTRLQTLITGRVIGDIFPEDLRSDSYVLLGTTTTRTGKVTVFYRGDLVTYSYPVALLDSAKDEIYSSEGAEIFR